MKLLVVILLSHWLTLGLFAQGDSCKVIQVLHNDYADTTGLNLYYQPKGIFLVQNGIYDFKIKRKKYFKYRIHSITGDSVSLAWTMDSIPSILISVNDIDKVIFPSLDNGVSGFPHPAMNKKEYGFSIACRVPYKFKDNKLCLNEDCSVFKETYLFMTSGYGWKPIYAEGDRVYMVDGSIIHELKRN